MLQNETTCRAYKFFKEIQRSTSQKLIVILLANPENDEIGNYFGRMMEYFDELTGKDINFYCAGYTDDYGFTQENMHVSLENYMRKHRGRIGGVHICC